MNANPTGNYQSHKNRLSIQYECMCRRLNCIIGPTKPILVTDLCINNQLMQPFIPFLLKNVKKERS